MTLVLQQQQRTSTAAPTANVAGLVEGIGTEQFGARLVGLLHDVCGADHCAVFQLGSESISALTISSFDPARPSNLMVERYVREGLWRNDPALQMARRQATGASPSVVHVDLSDMGYSALRPRIFPQVQDRLLVCGRRDNLDFGLSVVRTRPNPEFGAAAIEQLTDLSNTLLSAMAKHISVLAHKPNLALALTELPEIENCFIARSDLPRRELEVCARILYGLSSIGISLDLGIGDESVKTYRKRAYQRLRIGSERELLHWYLAQWSAWRGHLYAPVRNTVH